MGLKSLLHSVGIVSGSKYILFDNMKMRTFLIVFLSCLFCLIAQARLEHLKFMDIPINGSINSFQKKLLKKGIIPDPPDNTPTFMIMRQGRIDCFPQCFKFNDSFPAKYSVFIEYEDVWNAIKHRESLDNDL